jgi:cell division septum initiation protein DivIVA
MESLRRQLRAAAEAVTAENADKHVKQILQTAKNDAARLRVEAQAEADEILHSANDSASRTRAAAQAEWERLVAEATERVRAAEQTARRRLAGVEKQKAEIEAEITALQEQARAEEARLSADREAERNRLDAEHEAERNRLDAESLAKRKLAEEDFEITLRLRRTAAHKELAEQRRAAEQQARQTIADAVHEVRRLHVVRNDIHQVLGELQGKLGAALQESLAATPNEPELPPSGAAG